MRPPFGNGCATRAPVVHVDRLDHDEVASSRLSRLPPR